MSALWKSVRKTASSRLAACSLALGLMYALCTTLGWEMLDGKWSSPVWQRLLLFVLSTAVFSALCMGLLMLTSRKRRPGRKAPKWLDRIAGNGFLVFVLLLVCWVPVWLAYWPGTFGADSLTQFESYYNAEPSAHHPLLHTALLSFCMMTGIDNDPDGFATNGLALYSAIQTVLVAGCLSYACHWLKRRGAPVWTRIAVPLFFAVFPFFAPWAFNAQKDVLFGALVLVFCLQLMDLWRFGIKPLRLIFFVLIALLMMFFRNNGVYALVLTLPVAVWCARKGTRIRVAALLAACIVLYFGINTAVINAMEAEPAEMAEMLSLPLQQIARTLRDHPEAIEADEEGLVEALYEGSPAEVYHPLISDPVRWAADYDTLDENLPALLRLWVRMGFRYPASCTEAFLEQNLPYILPCTDMLYNIQISVVDQHEWFPIVTHSYLPGLRELFETYDRELSFFGIPGVKLLSHPATYVWLALFGFVWGIFRRRYAFTAAFGFLLALWITCLLGPVAIMRYVLGLYYAVPVLLAAMGTKD